MLNPNHCRVYAIRVDGVVSPEDGIAGRHLPAILIKEATRNECANNALDVDTPPAKEKPVASPPSRPHAGAAFLLYGVTLAWTLC